MTKDDKTGDYQTKDGNKMAEKAGKQVEDQE